MYYEILSEEQKLLLPFIQSFKSRFYLAGGTAIALQIGHRRSIDFDLFSRTPFSISSIQKKVAESFPSLKILYRSDDQIHYILNGVKVTFFHYPYQVPSEVKLDKIITMPNLIHLAAMKAFALGRRAKWKDYVDLYFLLRHHFSLEEINNVANELFGEAFSTKLFKQQLAYFDDIDYREEVFSLSGFEVNEDELKEFMIDVATQPF